jgi:hypothetical protein
MSKDDVLARYPDFPPDLIMPYSELSVLPDIESKYQGNLKVVRKTENGEIHLVMSNQLYPNLSWCDGIYEVAAILVVDGRQDYSVGDALGFLVYYTVNSKTDEISYM